VGNLIVNISGYNHVKGNYNDELTYSKGNLLKLFHPSFETISEIWDFVWKLHTIIYLWTQI